MSNTARFALLAAGLAVATGSAFASRPAAVHEIANPLRVGMFADGNSQRAFMGTVEFKITNTSGETLKVPSWQLPSGTLNSDLFDVYYNGKKVEYTGPMIKRTAPVDSDYTVLRPGESKLVSADLSSVYDLSRTGEYTIKFKSYLQGAKTDSGRLVTAGNGRLAKLETVPLRMWVDANNTLQSLRGSPKGKPGSGSTVVNGVTFKSCSSTQITQAGDAVVQARVYSGNAKGYLNGGTVGPRYTTWFGAYTNSRYNTAQQHFVAIDAALNQTGGQITINCGCNQSYYAYVYPNKPYEIFVCKAFWSAPLTGTDSKAGTLIHETSHFDIVANTDDVVYGQSGAKNLALSNPDDALRNADNHEYFGENNPKQN